MRGADTGRAGLRVKAGVAVLVGILALSLVAIADARSTKVSGGVEGDANAKVSMKIVKRNGKPRKVKKFKVTDLDHRCGLVVREFDRQFPGNIKINRVGITNRFNFVGLVTPPSGVPAPNDRNNLLVTGQMRRNAKKVTGTVDSTINLAPVPSAISNTCVTTTNREYTARK
jgi:hypothetical protein